MQTLDPHTLTPQVRPAHLLGVTGLKPWHLPPLFFSLFIYFQCSQYLFTASFIYSIGFYLLLAAFLWLIIKDRGLAIPPATVGARACLLFFAYVFLHALLLRHPGQSTAHSLTDTVFNAGYVLMAFLVGTRPAWVVRLIRSMIVIALVAAIISFLLFYGGGETNAGRMLPIGRAHNPIPASSAYAVAALMAAYLFLQPATSRRWKKLCAAAVIVITLMILLTECRGPLLALLLGDGLLLLLARRWKIIAAGLLLAGILAADYVYYCTHTASLLHAEPLYATFQRVFFARDSFRLPIWQKALGLIAEQPWQGYGLQAPFSLEGAAGAVNPHNLYIGTAYYLGIPGLLLLLLPLLAAFAAVLPRLKSGDNALYAVLLVHAIAATLTNFGQVVKAPNALWTIYWLPIVLALAVATKSPPASASARV